MYLVEKAFGRSGLVAEWGGATRPLEISKETDYLRSRHKFLLPD